MYETIDLGERSSRWGAYDDPQLVAEEETRVLAEGGDDPPNLRRARLEQQLFPSLVSRPIRIGRFVLLSRLGAGGMGEVYAAYDEQLDRRVAIKLLSDEAAEIGRASCRERVSSPV